MGLPEPQMISACLLLPITSSTPSRQTEYLLAGMGCGKAPMAGKQLLGWLLRWLPSCHLPLWPMVELMQPGQRPTCFTQDVVIESLSAIQGQGLSRRQIGVLPRLREQER